jgi:hypothetical protein
VCGDQTILYKKRLSFELIEKPYECYHVIALPINITFILGGIPRFLRCVGIEKFPRIAFGRARLNYLATLYLELFENPTISKFGEQETREMRLPRRWAVAKTLKMC